MSEPAWMRHAKTLIGTKEVPGAKSNPKIIEWARKVGSWLGIAYTDDATPWCGLFVAACLVEAGLKPAKIAVRAKAWVTWGDHLDRAIEGAVLVFERAGGGHVGFYAGETSTAYRVLGGNQGDAVSYAWIAKDRCIAIRWPTGEPKTSPMKLAGVIGPLSRNEA